MGVPALVSLKKKLPSPLLMATDIIDPSNGPVLMVSNRIVPESEERFAVPLNDVTRFPKASWTSKVVAPETTPASYGLSYTGHYNLRFCSHCC